MLAMGEEIGLELTASTSVGPGRRAPCADTQTSYGESPSAQFAAAWERRCRKRGSLLLEQAGRPRRLRPCRAVLPISRLS